MTPIISSERETKCEEVYVHAHTLYTVLTGYQRNLETYFVKKLNKGVEEKENHE
ncbi:hypothetical protein WN55_03943 [Dufourea novaeangliae]|uniref:Uncharacterized protein n=1 Tax=Dufourea novaeangliae TaxID=178035 RepID=A0A154PKM8_DUFNO|nr:hypothetical protein WN55_03943 [Dufourea novaeangliae]